MVTVGTVYEATSLTDTVERYDIWERRADGSVRSQREDFRSLKIAQQTADEYNVDARENNTAENSTRRVMGRPEQEPDHYFVVKTTLSFEEVK